MQTHTKFPTKESLKAAVANKVGWTPEKLTSYIKQEKRAGRSPYSIDRTLEFIARCRGQKLMLVNANGRN